MDKHLQKFINFFGFIFGSFLNVVIFFVIIALIYNFSIKSFNFAKDYMVQQSEVKDFKEVEIDIKEGASLKEVSKELEKKGIISSAVFFQLENFVLGNNKPFKGGKFVLNTQMDTNTIISSLRAVVVKSKDKKITIQEGRSVKEIAQYLESIGIVSAVDFLEVCNTGDFKYSFLEDIPERENRLEGYLFPDTYYVSEHANSYEIINKMLSNFDQKFNSTYRQRAEELNLTIDQVITIASVIEKEINRDDERAKAASVIYNRLNKDMKLQMCSTIIYVLDKRKDRLLDADLEVKSPYNTYINSGLPVGPIANPGIECMKAALYPIESDLLYFVVKNEETGEHVFTNNYDEFLNAKSLYNQKY